jgi:hypothetical protein
MLTSMSLGAQISEMDDFTTRVLPQTDDSDLFRLFTISEAECPESRPPDSRTPECRYPDMILLRYFISAYEGLTPVHLLLDLTADRLFTRDLIVQIISPMRSSSTTSWMWKPSTVQIFLDRPMALIAPTEPWCFSSGLGIISNVQRPRPFPSFLCELHDWNPRLRLQECCSS